MIRSGLSTNIAFVVSPHIYNLTRPTISNEYIAIQMKTRTLLLNANTCCWCVMTTIHAHSSHTHARTNDGEYASAFRVHKRKYSLDFVCRMRGVHSPTAPRDRIQRQRIWKKNERNGKNNTRRKQRARTKLLSNVIFGRLCPSERFAFSIDSAVLRTSAFLFLHTFDFHSEYTGCALTKNQWNKRRGKK